MSDETAIETPAEKGRHHKLEFTGRGSEIFPIILVNLLLTIVTLGIYRFWAKTNIRRFLWGHVEFDGEPFEYTGRGGELFVGFLIVFFLIILPLMFGLQYLASKLQSPGQQAVLLTVIYLISFYLIGIALYRTQVYRMSRTLWRGIRGAQTGSSMEYGWLFFKTLLVQFFTLGIMTPTTEIWLWNYEIDRKRMGKGKFSGNVDAKPLYKTFLGCLAVAVVVMSILGFLMYKVMLNQQTGLFMLLYILGILSMSLIFVVYRAKFYNHIFSHLKFENLQFDFSIKPMELFKFSLVNVLLIIFTLGLAYHYVMMRWVRFFCEKIELSGQQEFGEIGQSPEDEPRFGEGLAEAFDLG